MNTKLLASVAVFVLVAAIVSIPMMDSAFAAEDKKDKAKKEVKTKAKKEMKKEVKKKAKKEMKKEMKETKTEMKKEMKETKGAMGGKAATEVTVEMAAGTAANQKCDDKCFMPSTVNVAVGGTVTWKNMDSAAHTATASDGSFDTSLVNAGASSSNTFKTAGTYPYMCIVHPWMKGTVNVQ